MNLQTFHQTTLTIRCQNETLPISVSIEAKDNRCLFQTRILSQTITAFILKTHWSFNNCSVVEHKENQRGFLWWIFPKRSLFKNILVYPTKRGKMCIWEAMLPNPKSSKKNSSENTLRGWYDISVGMGHRCMRLDSCQRKLTQLVAWKWAVSGKPLPAFQLQIRGHES